MQKDKLIAAIVELLQACDKITLTAFYNVLKHEAGEHGRSEK